MHVRRGWKWGKATPDLSPRGYLPGTVTCVGAEVRNRRPRKAGWRGLGTDGAGLTTRGLALLGEVERVPSARGGVGSVSLG